MALRERRKTRQVASAPGPHVAIISPEVAPFAKTGGLADMTSGLSLALESMGSKVSLIMPAYRQVLGGGFPEEDAGGMGFPVAVSNRTEIATVLKSRLGQNINVYLIRCDRYFDREHFYGTPEGDYPDNAERFAFFSRAALEVSRLIQPDVIHCHDWQSGLVPVFLRAQPEAYPEIASARTVFTVHNLGYQGLFWEPDWHLLNLDRKLFNPGCLEFYGKINFLKGGVVFADKITTVSPSYAEEIQTPEQGFGLDGVFRDRARDLTGILNGADYGAWNPESDPLITENYGARRTSGKKKCKAELQKKLGLAEEPGIPLVGIVSRLVSQKGLDLIEATLDDLLGRGIQLALLGSGEKKYEELLTRAAEQYGGKAAIRLGFDENLAHRIEAGADLFLMPSLYEPCGLNQIYSLKYGTIPIVRATGGLKDTVEDYDEDGNTGTGFVFGPNEPGALLDAVDRALRVFPQKRKWNALMKRAMAADFSWDRSAREYDRLYRELAAGG